MTTKRDGGLARCEKCGMTLIAPFDGQPYWCTECSYEDELRERKRMDKIIDGWRKNDGT